MLYLAQTSICAALMCLVYLLFLRNRAVHVFNRIYLLLAALLPLAIPFARFPRTIGEQVSNVAALNVRLPEFAINSESGVATSTMNMVWMGYSIVSFILLCVWIYKWSAIRAVIRKNEQVQEDGYTLVLNSGAGPGSWHKYIFLPGEERNETIIRHEAAHIRLQHTKDLVLLNLLQVFFWPNLLLVWIKKELMQVHEFQADAAAGIERTAYSELLVSSVFGRCSLPQVHSFISHPIKRRLMMLRKKENRVAGYIAGGLSGLVSMALILCFIGVQSCKNKSLDVKQENAAIQAVDMKDVDKMPEFKGNLAEYLGGAIKYPEEARKNNIEGRVMVAFIIDKDGNVVNAVVKKSPNDILSAEALRVVRNMPKWKPGEDNGKKVAVEFKLPIMFRLN